MHYLVVSEPEEGYFEHEIEHEKNCPMRVIYHDLMGREIKDYACDIALHVEYWGFYDIEDDERFKKVGKYPIDWYGYFPTSMFEDNEVYIYFVKDKNA